MTNQRSYNEKKAYDTSKGVFPDEEEKGLENELDLDLQNKRKLNKTK